MNNTRRAYLGLGLEISQTPLNALDRAIANLSPWGLFIEKWKQKLPDVNRPSIPTEGANTAKIIGYTGARQWLLYLYAKQHISRKNIAGNIKKSRKIINIHLGWSQEQGFIKTSEISIADTWSNRQEEWQSANESMDTFIAEILKRVNAHNWKADAPGRLY